MADGNIHAARTKLGRAVQDLTAPRPAVYHTGTYYAPSLYDALRSDLAGTQGDTRSPAKSLPPLWIDAAMLIVTIDSQTVKWLPVPGDTKQRLQRLAFKTWRPQDTETVTDMAHTVTGWCEDIKNLLDPEARKFLPEACPSCGKNIVYRRDSGGDRVRQPALRWTAAAGFSCAACQASWGPEQTLFFSRLLGYDLPEGVLE